MLTRLLSIVASAVLAAGILLALSALPSLGAPSALAPDQQQPVRRATLLSTTVEIAAGNYDLVMAELIFDPGAETPLHQHPGPSMGYVQTGRVAVQVPGEGTNSFSSGSAISHPWDRPHIFRNNGEQEFKMLSFELIPVAPSD